MFMGLNWLQGKYGFALQYSDNNLKNCFILQELF